MQTRTQVPVRQRRRTPPRSPAPLQGGVGKLPPLVRLGPGPGELKKPEGDPAPSEANTTTGTDPPPNPQRRLPRLFTQKDEENFIF